MVNTHDAPHISLPLFNSLSHFYFTFTLLGVKRSLDATRDAEAACASASTYTRIASALERRELKRNLSRVVDPDGCDFHLSPWTRRPIVTRSRIRRRRVVERRYIDDTRGRAIAGAIAVATDVVVAM
jgi:hypothetical protein